MSNQKEEGRSVWRSDGDSAGEVGGRPVPLREMYFSGEGVDELIGHNVKLMTLRVPSERYDFEIGEKIAANCGGQKIELVVVGNVKKPLKDFSDGELLLDGYRAADGRDAREVAVEALRTYGERYAGIDQETMMQGIMTVSCELFGQMSEECQKELFESGFEVLNNPRSEFKKVLWVAWCNWILLQGGGEEECVEFIMNSSQLKSEYKNGVGMWVRNVVC